MELEPVNPRRVSIQILCRYQARVYLEEDIVEARPKVGAVDGGMAGGFGIVDVFAPGTVELDSLRIRHVGLAHWQESLRFARYARALAKVVFLEFLHLQALLAVAAVRLQ